MEIKKYIGIFYELVALVLLLVFSYVLVTEGISIENDNESASLYLFCLALFVVVLIFVFCIFQALKLWGRQGNFGHQQNLEKGMELKIRAVIILSLGIVVTITFVKFWWNYIV